MTSSDLNQLVKEAELNIQRIRSEAETLVAQIKQTMPSHLTEMANNIVKNTIEENPLAIENLGEKLKDLKTEISSVIASFPDEVEKNFATGIIWAHTKTMSKKDDTYMFGNNLQKEIESTLSDIAKLILGKVGSVFIQYGVAQMENNSYWKKEYSSSILFSYGMDFYHHSSKTEFQKYRVKYAQLIPVYVKALQNLETAINNRDKGNASKLWDEA